MEHFSVIKQNRLLIYSTTWMNAKEFCKVEKNPKRHPLGFYLYNILKMTKS